MADPIVTTKDLDNLRSGLHQDLASMEHRINTIVPVWAEQMIRDVKRHFDVVAENLLYDFRGVLKDKISQHEDRIVILEKHVGIK